MKKLLIGAGVIAITGIAIALLFAFGLFTGESKQQQSLPIIEVTECCLGELSYGQRNLQIHINSTYSEVINIKVEFTAHYSTYSDVWNATARGYKDYSYETFVHPGSIIYGFTCDYVIWVPDPTLPEGTAAPYWDATLRSVDNITLYQRHDDTWEIWLTLPSIQLPMSCIPNELLYLLGT